MKTNSTNVAQNTIQHKYNESIKKQITIRRDNFKGSKSLNVVRDLTFSSPQGRIINRDDANGIVTSSREIYDLTPPPLTKDIMEMLSKERIESNGRNIQLQNNIQAERQDVMHLRQLDASRHLRLANRMGSVLIRDQIGDDYVHRLFESEVSCHEILFEQVSLINLSLTLIRNLLVTIHKLRRHDDLRRRTRQRNNFDGDVERIQRAFIVLRP